MKEILQACLGLGVCREAEENLGRAPGLCIECRQGDIMWKMKRLCLFGQDKFEVCCQAGLKPVYLAMVGGLGRGRLIFGCCEHLV